MCEIDEADDWEEDPYYFKPKADGPYWLYNHKYGSIYPMIHNDNRWHDSSFDGMKGIEIVEGPIPYPTQAQIDGQAEHFQRMRYHYWREWGFDPIWPMEEMPKWNAAAEPNLVPHDVINGYYWIKRNESAPIEFVQGYEGTWGGMAMDPYMWAHTSLDRPPLVLFGPIPKPPKSRVKLLTPSTIRH